MHGLQRMMAAGDGKHRFYPWETVFSSSNNGAFCQRKADVFLKVAGTGGGK